MIDELTVPYARGLRLHVARPTGASAAPVVLDLHGGAWTHFGPEVDRVWRRGLARRGYVVASAEIRLAPADPWPAMLDDARAAACWLRAHARTIGGASGWLGALGGSTGGHLATMLGLVPDAGGPVDAVAALWPVLDVPARYEMVCHWLAEHDGSANTTRRGGPPPESPPRTERAIAWLETLRARRPALGNFAGAAVVRLGAWLGERSSVRRRLYRSLAVAHRGAFGDVATMAAASPRQIVVAGHARHTPPILVIQGARDTNVTPAMTEAFAAAYRAVGGAISVELWSGLGHSFGNVPGRAADALIATLDQFFIEQRARAAEAA